MEQNKIEKMIQHRNVAVFMALLVGLLLLPACGAPQESSEESALTEVYLNPYKEECQVEGELRLCYVASVGDTSDFSSYEGQIENLDYEWGYGYALSGSGDENSFRVDEVVNKTAEPGGIQFSMIFTGGGERIVQIGDGLYEIYGEKSFSCDPSASCETLDNVIGVDEPITFEFETPVDPTDPYTLLDWQSEAITAQVGEEPALMNNLWVLQTFTVDENVQEPVLSGSEITANFTLEDSFSSGTVVGNGSCNDYQAAVTIAGNSLRIEDLERGQSQCTDPAGIMGQEQKFVSALTVAESFSVTEGRLEIVYDSGEGVLHFVAAEK